VSTVGTVRVLIADDHSLFAKTLEALLAGTPGVEVVGIAEDGLERPSGSPSPSTPTSS
jgi:DNA-binding NarL/FixJ family response regulator